MPLPAVLATAAPHVQSLLSLVRTRPILTASAVGIVPLLSYIASSYRGFLALGPGGLPRNFLGWAIQACLQPIGRTDTTDPAPFSEPSIFPAYAPHGRTCFLGAEPLSQRRGNRPAVPGYIAPQRQVTEKGDAEAVARMNAFLVGLERLNPGLLSIRPSGLEDKDSPALWLKPHEVPLPTYLVKSTKGEVVHVHPEASSHMVLSLADAETATEQGWAQRHKLSGVFGRIPWGYVLVYAPRDEDEFAVWKRLVGAAVAFTTAGSGLKARVGVQS